MTHPIPGADSERPLPPLPVAGYWIETNPNDYYTKSQMVEYVLSDRRAAAKVGANVAAESIANDPKFQRALATYWQNSTEESRAKLIEVIDHRIAAGAPAETPKQSHAEWVLRQISQLAPHQGATAIFMATEGLAAQPAPAATYCDSINNFLSETLEIPEKQTAFRDRFSKWLNLGCPLPDATPIAGDVEKYAWTTWELCQACVKTGFGPLEAQTLLNNLEATRAAMLANSSSGEAG